MNEILHADVDKGGVTPIAIGLRRDEHGLRVSVRTTKAVEEFIAALGGGRTGPLENIIVARRWRPVRKDVPLPAVYLIQDSLGTFQGDVAYELNGLGTELYDRESQTVKLGFLRFVGVSEGAGVEFGIKGAGCVYSLPELRELRDHIARATYRFYVDYMRPVDFTIRISTQEVRGEIKP